MEGKEKIDYLPLGSIVILKGGVQKVVIIARGLVTAVTVPAGFFDYGGCLYRESLGIRSCILTMRISQR